MSCLGLLRNGVCVARYDADIFSDVRTLKDIEPPDEFPHEAPEFDPNFKETEIISGETVNDNDDAGEPREGNDVRGETP